MHKPAQNLFKNIHISVTNYRLKMEISKTKELRFEHIKMLSKSTEGTTVRMKRNHKTPQHHAVPTGIFTFPSINSGKLKAKLNRNYWSSGSELKETEESTRQIWGLMWVFYISTYLYLAESICTLNKVEDSSKHMFSEMVCACLNEGI